MTRAAAIAEVRRLTLGLPDEDLDGRVARLMERISADSQADLLRHALVEVGARALLVESLR